MDVKVEKLPKSQIKLEIELSKEEFDGFLDKAASKISQNMEVKGFRKGRAPKNIIEEKVGKENILIEAGDMAVQDSYKKAVLRIIDQNNLEPISQPEIKIKKIAIGDSLVFEAKTSVLPEIDLPDYRRIVSKIKKKETAVEEKEIESMLAWIQRNKAKFSAKTEPAQKGDFIQIEYWSPDLPEISEQNRKKDGFILGEGHFVPGFEDLLVGMEPGQEKNKVVLDIPKDHSLKKIAGRKITFNIKVEAVQKVEFPEITDEFARSLGGFENLESLKNNIREEIKKEKEMAENQRLRNELLDEIAKRSKIEIPDILIERETKQMLENFKKDVPARLNISFEEYVKKIKKSEQQIKEMLLPQAEKKVRNFLVLREIGKKENIEVSEQEIKKETDRALKYSADPKQNVDLEQLKDYSREVVKTEKIFAFLENLTQR